ncbi:MAG: hypothetical protein MUO78_03250 [candidate division Zixibacteria bacterium]|nr:hypothetical protein [candidate division Zixibacteria bacterium]
MKRTKIVKIGEIVISALILLMLACIEDITKFKIEYKDPISFEIFGQEYGLSEEYENFCKEVWNNELRYDINIRENTWKRGDYTVFVYAQCYSCQEYYELIFFTTTKPVGLAKQVYSTVTPFKFEDYPDFKAEKIKTYIFINHFDPVESKEEAKQLMNKYLDGYIEEYKDDPYNKHQIQSIKNYLLTDDFWEYYFWEYADHFIFYVPPSDFGGGIIVNKETSALDFLGSSVWMGTGKRYFPADK